MIYLLNDHIVFPPVEMAEESGLLAVGGDLSAGRLLAAYRHGIFPWFNEEDPICWWSPDPRCVLFPEKLRISQSMRQLFRRKTYRFTINEAFGEVIRACADTPRGDGNGTWLTSDMINAYEDLHRQGYALSGEAWLGNELAGGLYGVKIGKVFYGESMFHRKSNASKFAFISLVQSLSQNGLALVDCQLPTDHLFSLGAELIPRKAFVRLLNELTTTG